MKSPGANKNSLRVFLFMKTLTELEVRQLWQLLARLRKEAHESDNELVTRQADSLEKLLRSINQ